MAKKGLSAKQEQALELLIINNRMSGDSLTIEQLAQTIGRSRQTVSSWINHDDVFRAEYDRRIREMNKYAAAHAMNTMIELLDCKHQPTRLGAAKDLLDRAGYKPTEKVSVEEDVPVVIMGVVELED